MNAEQRKERDALMYRDFTDELIDNGGRLTEASEKICREYMVSRAKLLSVRRANGEHPQADWRARKANSMAIRRKAVWEDRQKGFAMEDLTTLYGLDPDTIRADLRRYAEENGLPRPKFPTGRPRKTIHNS